MYLRWERFSGSPRTKRVRYTDSYGKKFAKCLLVAENFHQSGAASLCPPDNSAHISSHNAVRAPGDILLATNHAEQVKNHLQQLHQRRLEENYQKACRRAEKKGRKLPPKEQYYDHWGYSYYSE